MTDLRLGAGNPEALKHSHGITDSCGCIFCDLDLPPSYDNIGPYHMRGEVIVRCTKKS